MRLTSIPKSERGSPAIRAFTFTSRPPTQAGSTRLSALITQQAIRRGSFRNVRELVAKIDAYVAHYNSHKRPFVWTATADSIFDDLQRICKLINGTQH